jgi:flagellar basal-body rod modification protein FlgD
MDFPNTMSADDLARSKRLADEVNMKVKKKDGSKNGDMGKDAFMKLLVTELRHQDPTQPMQDREFISQVAQFSALEQMTSINSAMGSLNRSARAGEAFSLLGKKVEAFNQATGMPVTGTVSRVFYRDNDLRLVVNNTEISLSDVHSVFPAEEPRRVSDEVPVPANGASKEAAARAYDKNGR